MPLQPCSNSGGAPNLQKTHAEDAHSSPSKNQQPIVVTYVSTPEERNAIITGLKTYNTTHQNMDSSMRNITYAAAVVHSTHRILDSPDGEPSSSSDPSSLSRALLFDFIESSPPSRQD